MEWIIETLSWNGINATTGEPLLPRTTLEQIAALACGEQFPTIARRSPSKDTVFFRAKGKVSFAPKPIRSAGISLRGGAM
jgi:hypothetical protein